MRILMFLWERWRKPNRLRRCRWDMPPPQCCIVRQFKSESAACLRRGARTENFNTPERSWTAARWANGVGGATGAMPRWRGRNGAHGGNGDDFAARPFFAGRRANVESVQMRGGGLRPFAARGGDSDGRWRQFGFRFRGGDERLSAAAAFSRLNESGAIAGRGFWRAGSAKCAFVAGRVGNRRRIAGRLSRLCVLSAGASAGGRRGHVGGLFGCARNGLGGGRRRTRYVAGGRPFAFCGSARACNSGAGGVAACGGAGEVFPSRFTLAKSKLWSKKKRQ